MLFSSTVIIAMAFTGSFFFGLTAVILKIGVPNQDINFGLMIRALASIPVLIVLSIMIEGSNFYEVIFDSRIFWLLLLSALLLLTADLLLMHILKEKAVGQITPIAAINPIFATFLLIYFQYAEFSYDIIFWILLIIFGVFLVTFEKSDEMRTIKDYFDLKALLFGLAIAMIWGAKTMVSIMILESDSITGLHYSTLEISILGIIMGIVFVIRNRNITKVRNHFNNRKSILYMLLAGIVGWVFGAILVFSAFNEGDPLIINPIIGLNPLFSVIISLLLKHENMNKIKATGIFLCIFSSIMIVI